MARAAAKAAHELHPGAWLASLEFEIATLQPQLVLDSGDGRRVWLYRAPFRPRELRRLPGQPPLWARLPGFFLRVDLPRSRLRFCPVRFVVGLNARGLSPLLLSSAIVCS